MPGPLSLFNPTVAQLGPQAGILPGDDPVNDRRGLANRAFSLIFGNDNRGERGVLGRFADATQTPEGRLGIGLLAGGNLGEGLLAGSDLQFRARQQEIAEERNRQLDALREAQFQALTQNRDATLALQRQQAAALAQQRSSQNQIAQQSADIQSAQERRQQEKVLSAEKKERSRTLKAFQDVQSQQDLVLKEIEEAIQLSGRGETGLVGQIAKNIGGTRSKQLNTLLTTIKANIGFDKLQSLRENSPTGGALGQVSNLEIQALQSVLGALDQGLTEEQLDANLAQVRDQLLSARQSRREAFINDFGEDPFPQEQAEVVQDPTLASPTTQFQEGQTATNPQTGEKIVFLNGQWVSAE